MWYRRLLQRQFFAVKSGLETKGELKLPLLAHCGLSELETDLDVYIFLLLSVRYRE